MSAQDYRDKQKQGKAAERNADDCQDLSRAGRLSSAAEHQSSPIELKKKKKAKSQAFNQLKIHKEKRLKPQETPDTACSISTHGGCTMLGAGLSSFLQKAHILECGPPVWKESGIENH